MPGAYQFSDQRAGDTFDGAGFQLTDNGETPIPLDLTGCRIEVKFVASGAPSQSMLMIGGRGRCKRLTTDEGGGLEITDAAAGKWVIHPFIWTLPAGETNWDAALTFASGRTITILEGSFTVLPDLTC